MQCGTMHTLFTALPPGLSPSASPVVLGCGRPENGQLGRLPGGEGQSVSEPFQVFPPVYPPDQKQRWEAAAEGPWVLDRAVASGFCTALLLRPVTAPGEGVGSLAAAPPSMGMNLLDRLHDAVVRAARQVIATTAAHRGPLSPADSRMPSCSIDVSKDKSYDAASARATALGHVQAQIDLVFRSPSAASLAFLKKGPGGGLEPDVALIDEAGLRCFPACTPRARMDPFA